MTTGCDCDEKPPVPSQLVGSERTSSILATVTSESRLRIRVLGGLDSVLGETRDGRPSATRVPPTE